MLKVERICRIGWQYCWMLPLEIIGLENQFLVFFLSGCLRQVYCSFIRYKWLFHKWFVETQMHIYIEGPEDRIDGAVTQKLTP